MSGEAEVVRLLIDLAFLLVAAKAGGWVAERVGQPPVLGELLAGLLVGPSLLGLVAGDGWRLAPDLSPGSVEGTVLGFLATLGAILLLFEVGLESDLRSMRKVGASSSFVALIGIAASFAAGYLASWALARAWPAWSAAGSALPPSLLHVLVGATFTATSVGITARVLGDMGRLRTSEARIILGAAVLDDVGGLLVLAAVGAIAAAAVAGGGLDPTALLWVGAGALLFLGLSIGAGFRLAPRALDLLAEKSQRPGSLLLAAVAFALTMAFLAEVAQLAAIVGAFVAGLLLAPARSAHRLFAEVRPVGALLVPLFFVTLGMRADLTQLEGHGLQVLVIGVALAAAAVLAKLACGLGVVRRQADRLLVGIGMVPRGEVGLIFAAFGLDKGILANWQYTALLLAVFVTTLVTPPWLKASARRFTHDAGPSLAGSEQLGRILEP